MDSKPLHFQSLDELAAEFSGATGSAGRDAACPGRTVVIANSTYVIASIARAGDGRPGDGATSSVLAVILRPLGSAGAIEPSQCIRSALTPREVEVLDLLAVRRTNAEIAERLSISPHTARHHVERVLRKLGVRSRHRLATPAHSQDVP